MNNREEFEKEFKLKWEAGHYILKMVKFIDESNDYAPINAVKTMSDEYYWVLALNTGWWAWQARVPEGYVVVPVDLVDEIEDKIWDNLSSNHTITNQEGDGFIPVEDIDLGGIYKAMIEAVEK